MKELDIIVHRTLFGDWDVANAGSYFRDGTIADTFKASAGYETFANCKATLDFMLGSNPQGITIYQL